ncbi:MAG: class I SAM-dependent DNA methyltransferase [Synergistaceae bacterium]|nr:class I SAM-dependent DNA methyltransferase [Synergistaceae bacterium]
MTEFRNIQGNEKSDTQVFWLALIRKVFGIIKPEEYIEFEKRVKDGHTKFIDAYVKSTGIIIEQKSKGKNLDEAFRQAKNYYDWLPNSQRGDYILTCDFDEIHVHDMNRENLNAPPEIIKVSDVSRDNLGFLLVAGETLPREVRISIKAGELVKALYDSLINSLNNTVRENHYTDAQIKKAEENINVFCVRLVFLLYAEDSGLFRKSQFINYFKPRAVMANDALSKLFEVLYTEIPKRSPYLDDILKEFPFVNGGLFKDNAEFPQLDEESKRIIIQDMAEGFNWSGINPTIFGAIFESTLNKETRKQQGIHYTSVSNIHKVIDPLFLDELTDTLNDILSWPESFERTQKLLAFQERLSKLKFLDPACGSGNFLTESFISLRRLENRIIAALPAQTLKAKTTRPNGNMASSEHGTQASATRLNENIAASSASETDIVKVKIPQFHGIESHDFAVKVAMTALWISSHQMWKETQSIVRTDKPPLPLEDYDGIKEGDAFKSEINNAWNIPHEDMLYIMGNPPFLGYSQQVQSQKDTVRGIFGNGKLDYVSCWFSKASERVQEKNVKAAFVATNSIVQGEQPACVFKFLSQKWGIKIDFAHLPFVWKNELPDPKKMAHVHVVIIAISTNPPEKRRLYDSEGKYKLTDNINFYLAEGPDEDVAESSDKPVSPGAPVMMTGNRAADGGNLIIEGEDYADFIKREPKAEKYIKRYMMGYEFIRNINRFCLWLVDVSPEEIRNMPLVYKRVKACREDRLKGAPDRVKLADSPHLFREQMNPKRYLAIPVTSSESRFYIPIGWLDDSVIPGNQLHIIPNATLYHFGILTSRVHMAWMRRVSGRLKSDYSYSKTITYHTFAWPCPTQTQRSRIESTAQKILDARAPHPESSFASLYDDSTMPPELRKAHRDNDAAVCEAYGWDKNISEEDIIARLFELYHGLTKHK